MPKKKKSCSEAKPNYPQQSFRNPQKDIKVILLAFYHTDNRNVCLSKITLSMNDTSLFVFSNPAFLLPGLSADFA